MSKKRAAFVREAGAKHFPETYKKLSHVVSAISGLRANNGDKLSARCEELLALLAADPQLVPYVAQGFTTLLPQLLPHLAHHAGPTASPVAGEGVRPVLRLARELVWGGAPREVLGAALKAAGHDALVRLALSADAARDVSEAATYLVLRGLEVSDHGGAMADAIAQDAATAATVGEMLTRCATDATTGLCNALRLTRACVRELDRAASVLARSALVDVLLSDARRDALCAAARRDAAVRDELLLLLVTLKLRTSCVDASGHEPGVERLREVLECDPTADTLPVVLATGFVTLCGDAGDNENVGVVWARRLRQLHACCAELRRSHFQGTARVACLERLQQLLFDQDDVAAATAVALLGLVPEALRTLHSCACDVDEAIGARACALLARLLETLPRPCADATADASRTAALAEELLLLGVVVVVEDALGDYSTGVVTAALRLLCALLQFSPQTHAHVVASRCMVRVVAIVHDVVEKDSCVADVNDAAKAPMLTYVMQSIALLLPQEAKRVVPEELLADLGTLVSRAATQTGVVDAALHTLVLLAAVHPLVASMTVDFEFLSEQLTQGAEPETDTVVAPTGTNAAIVRRSFDIMTAMVGVEPRVVTLEWIETLVQAVRRLPEWDASVPGFAYAVWKCLLQTLRVCEDGREYVFDEETQSHWRASLQHATTAADTELVRVLVCVAEFLPDALRDEPIEDVATVVQQMTAPDTADVAARGAVCDAALHFFSATRPNHDADAQLLRRHVTAMVRCVLAILTCDAEDVSSSSLRSQAVDTLYEAGPDAAAELLRTAQQTWPLVHTEDDGVDEVAVRRLMATLSALAALLRRGAAHEPTCVQLARWVCDVLAAPDALPTSCTCALLDAARQLFSPTTATAEVRQVARELLERDDGIVPAIDAFLRRSSCTPDAPCAAYELLSEVFLTASWVESEVAGLVKLQTFVIDHALADASHVASATSLLLLLLNYASVREALCARAPAPYAAVLQHIATDAASVSERLRATLYLGELPPVTH